MTQYSLVELGVFPSSPLSSQMFTHQLLFREVGKDGGSAAREGAVSRRNGASSASRKMHNHLHSSTGLNSYKTRNMYNISFTFQKKTKII